MSVRNQIQQFLAENFMFSDDGFPLSDQASLLEEGVVDSTGVLELLLFIEETYGIQVPDDEVVPENFDTVDNLVAFIARKTDAGS